MGHLEMTASKERKSQFLRNAKKTWLGYAWRICMCSCMWMGKQGWMGLVGARLTKINEIYMVSDVTYYIRLRFG